MKYSETKFTGKKTLSIFLLCLVVLLLLKCTFIDEIEYPEEMTAGETQTITVHLRYEMASDQDNTRLVIGFMAPRTWDIRNNTEMTYTTTLLPETDPRSSGSLTPIPAEEVAPSSNNRPWPEAIRNKYGIGSNVLTDLEWVAFEGEHVYTIPQQDFEATVTIKTTPGPQNLLVKLGVFNSSTVDGLTGGDYEATNNAKFTECIEVSGGVGNITDFCNPAINNATPSRATDNDIITFRYQGDVQQNALDGVDDVYFCGTAYTDTGRELTMCDQSEKTKMTKEFEFRNTHYLTAWPRDFFGVNENENITRIEYSFTNGDGSKELINQGTSEPFQYLFVCSE